MTVAVNETVITLTGTCGVEDVETLVDCLERHPNHSVDLSAAIAVHTAVWQALMVFRPKLVEMPASPLITEKVLHGLSTFFRENKEE